MTFEAAITTLRSFVGSELAVNLTDERHGVSDGYLADFAAVLSRVDEPIPGVDAPVYYFRFGSEAGFGLHSAMFKSAEWRSTGGVREFRVRCATASSSRSRSSKVETPWMSGDDPA